MLGASPRVLPVWGYQAVAQTRSTAVRGEPSARGREGRAGPAPRRLGAGPAWVSVSEEEMVHSVCGCLA